MKNSLINNLINHRKRLALLAFLILLALGFFVRAPKISGELSGFNSKDTQFAKAGAEIAEAFGSRRFIQIKITPSNEKSGQLFESLENLETAFTQLYPNAVIQSLHQSKTLLNVDENSQLPIPDLLQKAARTPLVNQLISADKQSFLFLVWMDTTDHFEITAYDKVVSKNYPGIEKIQSMSPFHIETEIARSIGRDLFVLSGIIGLFFTLFVLFAYRSFSAVVFIGIIIGVSMIPALVFFSILDLPMNLITVLVIPVILVLSLSDAIHILTGLSAHNQTQNYEDKLRAILSDYMVPSFYTSLTTAVAFTSFLFNESKNIQDFGLITGIAVLISYFLIYLTAPFLLSFVKVKSLEVHALSKFSVFFLRRKKIFAVGLSLCLIVSLFSLNQLRFNTDLNSFIPRNTKLYDDYTEIVRDFNSQLRLEVMIKSESPLTEKTEKDELKNLVINFHQEIENIDGVGSVSSIKDMEDFKSSFGAASSFIRFPTKKNPFVTEDKSTYRIDIRIRKSEEIESVNQKIRDLFNAKKTPYKIVTFSRALLMNETNSQVARSLLWSLTFSAGLIGILLLFITRSIRATLSALYTNLVPLSVMILIFWIFKLDLNVLTAITAVVCMGLIVDDTIHVLYRREILKKEIGELGFGMLTTSIILFGGFAAFLLSSFVPSQIFGIVCAITFLVAVIADLTLLPYLLEKKEK